MNEVLICGPSQLELGILDGMLHQFTALRYPAEPILYSLGGRIIGRDPPKPSLWPLENRSVATESSRVCNSATGWRGCLWETARLPYAHCSCCPHHKIISWMRTSAYREREALHVKLSTGKETRHRLISAHCTVVVVHVCDGAMWGL